MFSRFSTCSAYSFALLSNRTGVPKTRGRGAGCGVWCQKKNRKNSNNKTSEIKRKGKKKIAKCLKNIIKIQEKCKNKARV